MSEPITRTKEEVLAKYNAASGTNLTFQQLGIQLAMKELQMFHSKKLRDEVIDEIVI